jgi:hypothetical protein
LESGGHRHAEDVDVVFDDDRDAMQRADEFAGLGEFDFERSGFLERLRIEGDQGVQQRDLFVLGGDAVEVVLHHFDRRGFALVARKVQLVDGDFFDGEGLSAERGQSRSAQSRACESRMGSPRGG